MKLRAGIIFTPDKTDTHLEAKPYLRLERRQKGKIGLFTTKPPTWDGMVAKAGGMAERTAAKARAKTGLQYEVLTGDNDHVKWAKTPAEAERIADVCGGYVHDHTEGMVVYVSEGRKRRKQSAVIPDPGVDEEVDG
jgi:hypothetical protein